MNLLKLHPEILEAVRRMPLDAPGRWLTEKQLRPLMQLSPDEQLRSMGLYIPATILQRRLVG
jgi:hypothetical protein